MSCDPDLHSNQCYFVSILSPVAFSARTCPAIGCLIITCLPFAKLVAFRSENSHRGSLSNNAF
ncbi:MAG: hypothetical protein HRT83_00115 [Hyphomicrobiaceae bacterium]|nr:hypothetical protein [Hyphomicrobiaceae bacterium]